MKIKKLSSPLSISFSALTLTFVFVAAQLPAQESAAGRNDRVQRTQIRQAKRIRNGVRDGSLTRREGRKLARQQRRINKGRKKALADDGKIDRKEAVRLRLKQAKASRRIFKQKHDEQTQD